MKRSGVLLAMTAAVGMVLNSGVAWAGAIDPLGGMITGALVGSVFGPDKKHRTQNALIGAVTGAFLGSQLSYAQDQYQSSGGSSRGVSYRDDWDDSYGRHDRRHHHHHHRYNTTVIEREPRSQTVIVTPRRDTETVIVKRYRDTKVIVVEPRETRTYIEVEPESRHYRNFGYDTVHSSY
ncbi:MAG: glycine zipper 2TM domain-containing protein [Magnetococcales bacterium]|nr:glycine zipper 2TM domain-containing protein [Magnetococcales bacterium]